jgi:hypothetical protein
MDANEAKDFGIIDHVIASRSDSEKKDKWHNLYLIKIYIINISCK